MRFGKLLLLMTMLFAVLTSALTGMAEGEIIVVSLGDSYSSGEGVEPFYGQDKPVIDKLADQDWLAHRSENSWPGQLRVPGLEGTLSQHRGVYAKNSDGNYTLVQEGNWFFVAASGARTWHLTQSKAVGVSLHEKRASFEATLYLDPQLEIFDALAADGKRADYVTLTLGGNDVGFANLVGAAIADGPLAGLLAPQQGENQESNMQQSLEAIWDVFYEADGQRNTIKDAYRAVAEAAGPQAAVIVAGYPTLISEDGKGIVGGESARLLNEGAKRFNSELEAIVNELQNEGVNIHFVSVESEFAGHEAYASGKEYLNGVIFGAKSQDLSDSTPISGYSMHPNLLGIQAYARCVQAKIDELEAAKGK